MIGEKIIIRGGRVIDPANGVDASVSVCIADGKIEAVGDVPKGFAANQEIDAQGQIVCPGFVDLCVRLREPGQEHKATIASETAAAAAAGVTTLCCPPDTRRVIDTPALVNLLRERADGAGKARVIPIGALTRGLLGKELCSMMALKGAGCFAVSNAYAPMENLLVLRRALEYAANCGLLVIVRPEEPALRNRGCAHDGAVSSRLGLPVIPYSAETVAVAQTLVLAEQTQARVHFGQLSCARAVAMIAEAQSRGVKVSADVAIHQLHLTEHAVDGFDANADVTREKLRSDLAASIELGMSVKEIAAVIGPDYAFSPERAELIAQTERAFADVAGNMIAYRESGVVSKKEWALGSEHDMDDECDENADAGAIDLDEDFPSGDDAAPAHPGCICDVLPVVDEDDASEKVAKIHTRHAHKLEKLVHKMATAPAPVINVTVEAQPAPVVNLAPVNVTVEAPKAGVVTKTITLNRDAAGQLLNATTEETS